VSSIDFVEGFGCFAVVITLSVVENLSKRRAAAIKCGSKSSNSTFYLKVWRELGIYTIQGLRGAGKQAKSGAGSEQAAPAQSGLV